MRFLYRLLFLSLLWLAVSAVRADSVAIINQQVNEIVYDPVSMQIYATVPSSAGSNGNSIARIDPVTAQVVSTTFIGSEPSSLRVSDDGLYLYAFLSGAQSIRRFDLSTQTAGLQFSLDNLTAEDMQVIPGHSDSLVVSRSNYNYSPRLVDMVIYKDGVKQPSSYGVTTGANVFDINEDGTRLYGYHNEISDFSFVRFNLVDGQWGTGGSEASLFSGYGLNVKYNGGRLYVTNGGVYDPEAEQLLGTFNTGAGASVVPDASAGRVFFVYPNQGGSVEIHAFDPNTFLDQGHTTVTGITGSPASAIRWGATGLAFRTTGDQVVIVDVPSLMNNAGSDLTGDGKPDLLWRNTNTGEVGLWSMNGLQFQKGYQLSAGISADWQIAGMADFNHDGQTDIVWQNTQDGSVSIWLMNGMHLVSASYIYRNIPAGWKIVGLPDLNRDGNPDILWRNTQTGQVTAWIMHGTTIHATGQIASSVSTDWQIVGTADVDRNGTPDIIWHNTNTGDVAVWLMNGLQTLRGVPLASGVAADWHPVNMLDYIGTGKLNMIWQNTRTGDIAAWNLNNLKISGSVSVAHNIALEWRIMGAR